jgi:hypothetical protein
MIGAFAKSGASKVPAQMPNRIVPISDIDDLSLIGAARSLVWYVYV